jgi:phenylacetate-coenzyme A ligase PaaK-like adenylate-forming protein
MSQTLTVPDPEALAAVQKLCDISEPYSSFEKTHELFVKAMKEILLWHAALNDFYRTLLKQRNFDPALIETEEDLKRIPAIPAEFFKRHESVSIPRQDVFLHLTSSGTSGQKSQMFFDEWSIKSAQRMVDRIFEKHGWVTPDTKVNYLLYTYETEADSKLGTAYTDNFLCKYAPGNDGFFALRLTGSGSHEFDSYGCIEKLKQYEADRKPVRIFGFPAFLYFTLQRMKTLGVKPLKLDPRSLIFLGGGWKGHAGKAIEKSELRRMVIELLGIPDERIRDGFGSVEHCVPYIECSRHSFHVPVWSRVLIRDVRTLKPAPFGEKGFLQFVSPYITSVPANSVMMGDLASLYPASSCDCGLNTPYFVVHGRAGVSSSKSCAVAAAELLEGKAV